MFLEHELLELNTAYQNSVAVAADLRERNQLLESIITDLFQIAQPGAFKNALWARYQALHESEPELEPKTETISSDNPADYIL